MSRFLRLYNSDTQQEIVIDKYEARYRRLAMGFLNKLRREKKFIKHITLTQEKENYKPNILDGFFRKMRRYYGECFYLWTVEVQEERALVYGERVMHWHIIFGFPYDVQFGAEDVKRIQQYWKYGNLDIRPVKRCNVDYLMKYVTKALGVLGEEFYKIRKIGSSHVEGWLRQSWSKVLNVIASFYMMGLSEDRINDYWWSNGSAYAKDEFGHRLYIFKRPKTKWSLIDKMDEHPDYLF